MAKYGLTDRGLQSVVKRMRWQSKASVQAMLRDIEEMERLCEKYKVALEPRPQRT